MTKATILISIIVFGLISCGPKTEADKNESLLSPAELFVQSIENEHNSEVYNSKEIIQFDLNLVFGGKVRFDGSIQMTPNAGMVNMKDSNKTMIWDGQNAYTSDSSYSKARFDLLTWSYFFAAPYKLNDKGTIHTILGQKLLNEESFDALKLTFEDGIGDSPEDWYVVYKDQKSDLLAAMAYIVTSSKSLEEAEKDPHAITYEAYVELDGIPFATQWNFWTWNEEGELNKLLGSAVISNIRFIKKEESLFKPSSDLTLISNN